MKEDEFDEFITEMGKKAEATIGGGVAAVDRRESEKGGMNQSTVSFARVPRAPGWFAAGRGRRGGKRKEGNRKKCLLA